MIDSFRDYFETVVLWGARVDSRLGPTIEAAEPLTIEFSPGELVVRPKINYALGWAEMLMLIGGSFDLNAVKRVAPKAQLDLFTAQAAYGPKTKDQLPRIVKELVDHPESRRAVLYIGGREFAPDEQPCTCTIQFLVRESIMRTIVTMRSWDLVKGMAYDVTMFGGLALAVARCVGALASTVYVTAGSPHVYEIEREFAPYNQARWFEFSSGVPTDWTGIVSWANEELDRLDRGGTPKGVEVHVEVLE